MLATDDTVRTAPKGQPVSFGVTQEALVGWLMASGPGEELPTVNDFLQRPAWQRLAACRGVGIEAFFPAQGENVQTDEVRSLCDGCPVRPECLEYAVTQPELRGVWAGTSKRERKRMRDARMREAS